ncbi:unnamed protein product [Amoebophrya sp. A25]|nr:unnamed protein product [Amoebophrya sp. A25]|eukprot:GSA25T00018975001.1
MIFQRIPGSKDLSVECPQLILGKFLLWTPRGKYSGLGSSYCKR